MPQFKNPQLFNKSSNLEFYEQRYRDGYMKHWPDEKQKRIFNVIRQLQLPEIGEALDFGCGNGILTNVLKQALPAKWHISGVDISSNAIQNARALYPGCTFFESDDVDLFRKHFDFVFTHHVLEHVYDLNVAVAEITGHLKPKSAMLHILPCGNENSFEAKVCRLRKDGVDMNMGNRYFFEDEGHLRRLTTEELASLFANSNFVLAQDYYSGQYYGAINWITNSGLKFVSDFTDPAFALNDKSRNILIQLRRMLLALTISRQPVIILERMWRNKKITRSRSAFAKVLCYLPLFVFAKPVDLFIKWAAKKEWERKKQFKNGSEMYLFFKRD